MSKLSRDFVAVTPHDTDDLARGVPLGIYVGGIGTLIVRDSDGTQVSFLGVPAGTVLPIRPTGVHATGTSATGIVALY
jgi:hypothetical protein